MLTIQKLKDMKPGIFAIGEMIDSPLGLNMANSGKQLRWVATRGGIHDWTIYCHWATNSIEFIKRQGDKVFSPENIKKLVPCDDEAFKMYRF